jgi:hypothetical protein
MGAEPKSLTRIPERVGGRRNVGRRRAQLRMDSGHAEIGLEG